MTHEYMCEVYGEDEMTKHHGTPLLYLTDVIGDSVDYTNFCSSTKYDVWETDVAIPALKQLGFKVLGHFYTTEGDSFGPLTRGCRVEKDGVQYIVWYG